MEMALKIRNVLLKSFVVAFLLLIASHLFYFFNSEFVIKLMEYIYGVTPQNAALCISVAYAFMKIFAVMFFLIPALAIHCEFSKCKCKVFEKEGENVCENE